MPPTQAPSITVTLGERIAQQRKRRGLSQSALARESNVSREAIGKYERGEASASVEMAKRIADALGVTLDYLIGEGDLAELDRETLARVRGLQALPDDKRAHVLAVVDAFLRDSHTSKAYAA